MTPLERGAFSADILCRTHQKLSSSEHPALQFQPRFGQFLRQNTATLLIQSVALWNSKNQFSMGFSSLESQEKTAQSQFLAFSRKRSFECFVSKRNKFELLWTHFLPQKMAKSRLKLQSWMLARRLFLMSSAQNICRKGSSFQWCHFYGELFLKIWRKWWFLQDGP